MKVLLYMAMTANGMIATEDDKTSWSEVEWESYSETVKKFGNLIVGQRTHDIMLKTGEFSRIGQPFTVVVTEEAQKSTDSVVFVNSPQQALDVLLKKGFEAVLVGGGSTLNASFAQLGLVDEIILDVEPMIFGKGIPLFRPTDFQLSLELIETKKIGVGTVQLHYQIKK